MKCEEIWRLNRRIPGLQNRKKADRKGSFQTNPEPLRRFAFAFSRSGEKGKMQILVQALTRPNNCREPRNMVYLSKQFHGRPLPWRNKVELNSVVSLNHGHKSDSGSHSIDSLSARYRVCRADLPARRDEVLLL
jgi:hypothetical protein